MIVENNIDIYEKKLNELASKQLPFLFIIDFLHQQPKVFLLSELETSDCILYKVGNHTNAHSVVQPQHSSSLAADIISKHPISFSCYSEKFYYVVDQIRKGNSFLVNLTFPTEITLNASLREIFYLSEAPFKLWMKDQFVLFSPEPFIHIHQGIIYSYPMKGTIDASLSHAEERILGNQKEFAEHVTIVDLIRNDLSIHAKQVVVEKFRYIEKIESVSGSLLQVSSKIRGNLGKVYPNQLGTLLFSMLPAGSISGAPKAETLRIIAEAEQYNRGYYTGIFGLFDGENVYSSVMIRFIEKVGDTFVYKSGGGITANSVCENEYNEMIQKIYVPISRKPQYH